MLALLQEDPYLSPFSFFIEAYHARFLDFKSKIERHYSSLYDFATLHFEQGLHYHPENNSWVYREWAPEAYQLYITGDFNGWDKTSHPLKRSHINPAIWEIEISPNNYPHLQVGSLFKVVVHSKIGTIERLPALTFRAIQDPKEDDFKAQVWTSNYQWKYTTFTPNLNKGVFIYEAHVGMAQEEGKVGTYLEFRDLILPKIKEKGYNAIQLMAVQEHPYYGSFGYHVSNFFAPSSRFGTPDELKSLIDSAHELGLTVIMDVVHSHAVKNMFEGLNNFDGSGNQYFHHGEKGEHPLWDSKCFDYGKWEVVRFLLSNLRFWMEEYRFDGFRFDGVTSMLYHHHGNNANFGSYQDYLSDQTDSDALVYLKLANTLVKSINQNALTIAEDVSGFPGLCRTVDEGGIGFDYRLGMGIPDYWIKLTKDIADEDWNLEEIFYTLNNRRSKEKTIGYAESHDQALVGDKTLAFRLMDSLMYSNMSKLTPHHLVERGLNLHKIIRLLTVCISGEGYLNFMGNEFGHPEWIDFPRKGNDWSFHYARRQWSLEQDTLLKYHYLSDFDRALLSVVQELGTLEAGWANMVYVHNKDHFLVFNRGSLWGAVNLHPTKDHHGYLIDAKFEHEPQILLRTNAEEFGGSVLEGGGVVRENHQLKIYLKSRTAILWK